MSGFLQLCAVGVPELRRKARGGWPDGAGWGCLRGMPFVFSGATTLVTTAGRVACARCVAADTPWRRLRGLVGRRLDAGSGLLIRPASSIHTCFMRVPIDVVFLDRHGRVLRVVVALRPWRLAWRRGAVAVLELPAGACARAGLAAGDALRPLERPP
jgi:uncharacterized membrane protein (UPF0127 family)